MADVARAALADADTSSSPSSLALASSTNTVLVQKKRELERLLQLQREWTQTQQRKLEQKRELERLLGLDENGAPAPTASTEEEKDDTATTEAAAQMPPQQHTPHGNASTSSTTHAPARRKELRQLQQQADAVLKKQQETAAALTQRLEQLNSSNVTAAARSTAAATAVSAKRKREDSDAAADHAFRARGDARLGATVKRAAAAAPVPVKRHEFARALTSLTSAPTWERSALFRLATRHFLQTGQRISSSLLAAQYSAYSGKSVSPPTAAAGDAPTVLTSPALAAPLQPSAAPSDHRRDDAVPNPATHWRPGSQVLEIPTFCSSASDRLQVFIDLEKQAVERVCASIVRGSHGAVPPAQLIEEAALQSAFFANIVGASDAPVPSSVFAALARGIERSHMRDALQRERKVRYHRHRQFSELFIEMETWLVAARAHSSDVADTGSASALLSASALASASTLSTVKKPFDLEHDSVFQQLRSRRPTDAAATSAASAQASWRRKKLDPMKMLCLYELSGVCNDESCPYQHQKDFDDASAGDVGDDGDKDAPSNSSSNTADGDNDDVPYAQLLSREQTALLHDFAQLRAKVQHKWPVITGTGSAVPESTASASAPLTHANKPPEEPPAVNQLPLSATDSDAADFLPLESIDTVELDLGASAISNGVADESARYCHADGAMQLSIASLEAKVAREPRDTDSWLLLAIHQLDFEVKLGDDTTRVSDSARLLEQLTGIFRCVHLSGDGLAGASQSKSQSLPALDERKLQQSLHTLARAIEVEANAYCEALWLLYLHLSSLLPTRDLDSEVEMSEQAIQFIPSSHRLWVRYMSVGQLESIDVSEALHSRVLRHLLEPGTFQSHAANEKAPNLSALLLAIVLHLCIKLHSAGRMQRSLELLASLVQVAPRASAATVTSMSSSSDWCDVVRKQLDWCDCATLALVYAHAVLFDEIPRHVHKWLHVSGDQHVHVPAFAFMPERLERDCVQLEQLRRDDLHAADAAYAAAFAIIDRCDDRSSSLLDVVVNNRLVLTAFIDARDSAAVATEQPRELDLFVREHRALLLQLPGACFTATKLLVKQGGPSDAAHELMRDALSACPDTQFPEMLHYHLCALRRLQTPAAAPEDTEPQATVDISVVARLAVGLSSVDPDELVQSVASITSEANPFARAKALKRLLYGLLSAWIDELAAASRDAASARAVDVFVVLVICELMRVWLDPAAAIDALELVLQSSKLTHLSADARQLAWSARFVLHMDACRATAQRAMSSMSTRAVRAGLLQLFRRYMERMSVESEVLTQATRRMARALTHGDGVQAAIFECLFPQHVSWLLLDDNVEVFELCAAALPAFELPSHFASSCAALALSPTFCLEYAGVASHHWEWRKIRHALQRCLTDASTRDVALRALVALELAHQNVRGVAKVLDAALCADALSIEAWTLVLGMEILFGAAHESSSSAPASQRTNELVAELAKRKLAVRANLFNDYELLANGDGDDSDGASTNVSTVFADADADTDADAATTGDFCGRGLHCVPNAVMLLERLTTLNLRGNLLVALPAAIGRLTQLQVLDVSQNALLALPPALAQLTALRVLNAAHNNVSAVPSALWVQLAQLEELDLSANLLAHLPAPPLARLPNLRVLRIGDNALSSENVAQLRTLLCTSCAVDDTVGSATTDDGDGAGAGAGAGAGQQVAEHAPRLSTAQVTATSAGGSPALALNDDSNVEDVDEAQVAKGVASGIADDKNSDSDDNDEPITVDESADSSARTSNGDQNDVASGDTSAELEDEELSESDDDNTTAVCDSDVSESQPVDAMQRDDGKGPAVTATASSGMVATAATAPTTAIAAESSRATRAPAAIVATAHAATPQALNDTHPLESAIFSASELSDALERFINESNGMRRARVRQRNPALWRKYMQRQLQLYSGLGSCVLCDAPNAGWNQRFNTMVLCPSCLQCAVDVVQMRAPRLEPPTTESKEDNDDNSSEQ